MSLSGGELDDQVSPYPGEVYPERGHLPIDVERHQRLVAQILVKKLETVNGYMGRKPTPRSLRCRNHRLEISQGDVGTSSAALLYVYVHICMYKVGNGTKSRLCFMSDRCFSQPFRKPQTKPQPMGKHTLISACAGLSHLRISGEPKPELPRPPCSPCEHLPLDVRGEAKRFPGCDRRYQLFPAMFVAKKPTRGRRIGYFLLPRMLTVLLVLFPPGVRYVKDTPSAPRRGAAGST